MIQIDGLELLKKHLPIKVIRCDDNITLTNYQNTFVLGEISDSSTPKEEMYEIIRTISEIVNIYSTQSEDEISFMKNSIKEFEEIPAISNPAASKLLEMLKGALYQNKILRAQVDALCYTCNITDRANSQLGRMLRECKEESDFSHVVIARELPNDVQIILGDPSQILADNKLIEKMMDEVQRSPGVPLPYIDTDEPTDKSFYMNDKVSRKHLPPWQKRPRS